MFLLDYAGNRTMIQDIEDVEDVILATVIVVTGDESIKVVHRNGETFGATTYDAWAPYYDGEYDIIVNGQWIVDKDEWNKRKTSYTYLWGD